MGGFSLEGEDLGNDNLHIKTLFVDFKGGVIRDARFLDGDFDGVFFDALIAHLRVDICSDLSELLY